jgi:hypothetical protein
MPPKVYTLSIIAILAPPISGLGLGSDCVNPKLKSVIKTPYYRICQNRLLPLFLNAVKN